MQDKAVSAGRGLVGVDPGWHWADFGMNLGINMTQS